eukprot:3781357-Rhodomonas_salina.1
MKPLLRYSEIGTNPFAPFRHFLPPSIHRRVFEEVCRTGTAVITTASGSGALTARGEGAEKDREEETCETAGRRAAENSHACGGDRWVISLRACNLVPSTDTVEDGWTQQTASHDAAATACCSSHSHVSVPRGEYPGCDTRVASPPVVIRTRYAMSGTDIACAAARRLRLYNAVDLAFLTLFYHVLFARMCAAGEEQASSLPSVLRFCA